MRAGPLNRLVRVEACGNAKNASGEPVKEWSLFAEIWVNIKTLNGKQYVTADREVSEAAVSIQGRYRTDISANMRIVHGAKVVDGVVRYDSATIYEILVVLPDEARREGVYFACSAGVRA